MHLVAAPFVKAVAIYGGCLLQVVHQLFHMLMCLIVDGTEFALVLYRPSVRGVSPTALLDVQLPLPLGAESLWLPYPNLLMATTVLC